MFNKHSSSTTFAPCATPKFSCLVDQPGVGQRKHTVGATANPETEFGVDQGSNDLNVQPSLQMWTYFGSQRGAGDCSFGGSGKGTENNRYSSRGPTLTEEETESKVDHNVSIA